MREVNEAWRVLRNPAARAHYDDQLRERSGVVLTATRPTDVSVGFAAPNATTVVHGTATRRSGTDAGAPASSSAATAAAPPGAPRPGPRWSAEPIEVAELAKDDRTTTTRAAKRTRPWIPVVICLGVLGVVLLIAGAATSSHDKGVKLQTVEQFAVGSCVAVTLDESQGTTAAGEQARPVVVPAACDRPNSGKVVAHADFPVPCPQGTRAVLLPTSRESLCLTR